MRDLLLKAVLLLCACVLVACPEGCENNGSPTGFSDNNGPVVVDAPRASDVDRWSPYIGIHPFSPHTGQQQKYLLPLIESGAVRGVRIDTVPGNGGPEFKAWLKDNGVHDFLAVFPNEFLRLPNVWEELRAQMSANSDVQYWEIGNEVDLFIGMSPEEYTPIFLDLHARATREFPHQTVMPMPIFGASNAVGFLERMLDLGVEERAKDPEIPLKILSVHYYGNEGPFLRNVKHQIERIPTVEIWVTETGQDDMSRHVWWVQQEYERMRVQLRASRIYFYVFSECTEFAMVYGLADICATDPPRFSPLYDALTGGAR